MHRTKHHKIKQEMPETSSTRSKNNEEHDLAYYIHDRVELMHQVFSIIKPKELKAMAPECVQDISIDDLQELCTEELLGISSKRLCAILDGADPPTDTESSSSEPMETISLDSISSDEEILSQPCTKIKKHKHRKHKSKGKHKRKNSNSSDKDREIEDRSKASRAGLTVLELLELQARARAIRAQLQQDNTNKQETAPEKHDSSDEVEIKEEPPEVVEISSEDEKPKIEGLTAIPPSPNIDATCLIEKSASVKRVNNLVITVPQTIPSRRIKLNRNKIVRIATDSDKADREKEKNYTNNICQQTVISNDPVETLSVQFSNEEKTKTEQDKNQVKLKRKQKKKSKKNEKDGSDHDEITLQLSDTEKMDLLENFNREDYDNFTSSSSKDSESSSEDESVKDVLNKNIETDKIDEITTKNTNTTELLLDNNKTSENIKISDTTAKENHSMQEVNSQTTDVVKNVEQEVYSPEKNNAEDNVEKVTILSNKENLTNDCNLEDHAKIIKIGEDTAITLQNEGSINENVNLNIVNTQENNNEGQIEEGEIISKNELNEELSDGEISDKNCTKVDPGDASSKVVYISDEEMNYAKTTKNKKKEKKSKKQKKSKKKDFRESGNQNFFEINESKNENSETEKINVDHQTTETKIEGQPDNILTIDVDDDDIFEIFELSDESSDVEGDSVLSKEPTAAEIAALSAKIDEIHNEDIVINKKDTFVSVDGNNEEENISWRDRYLDSKKVKRVLTTSNILNALRKKNKDIKKMLEATKNVTEGISPKVCESNVVVEGSIEHFKTLEGSTKYVDPIETDKEEKEQNEGNSDNKIVSKEMEKNAKLLLKMYKKLLKYNDINKQKDPNKKKKKKQKRNKDKEKVKTSQ
ncbi:repetitive organellar protein-like [Nymphalis io]|uniref:repetitive organellar protein-like n=1 Tax=Inachis io TaxID=171585 RepID=UPI0021686B95|nr:repetitive organellar protein-like [Nymphalis io]XP_050346790.1 repetitive organellar protein-like [Nymphalis io]